LTQSISSSPQSSPRIAKSALLAAWGVAGKRRLALAPPAVAVGPAVPAVGARHDQGDGAEGGRYGARHQATTSAGTLEVRLPTRSFIHFGGSLSACSSRIRVMTLRGMPVRSEMSAIIGSIAFGTRKISPGSSCTRPPHSRVSLTRPCVTHTTLLHTLG